MPIYLEFLEYFNGLILNEKRNEILQKIKKPTRNSELTEKLAREQIDNCAETRRVVDYKLAKDGSTLVYGSGTKEPMRFLPDELSVNTTAIYKRVFTLILGNLSRMNWFERIITALAIKFNFNLVPEWFEYVFSLNQILLKDEHYSEPVKELRRVLKGRFNQTLIDAFTLILEIDSAYRYKFQDVVPLIDKSKLKGIFSAIKEVQRLFDILSSREINEGSDIKVRWANIKKILGLIMFFSPKIRKQIIDILKELDFEKIKLSKEDIFWTNEFGVYNYRGLSWDERKQENIKNYGEN